MRPMRPTASRRAAARPDDRTAVAAGQTQGHAGITGEDAENRQNGGGNHKEDGKQSTSAAILKSSLDPE